MSATVLSEFRLIIPASAGLNAVAVPQGRYIRPGTSNFKVEIYKRYEMAGKISRPFRFLGLSGFGEKHTEFAFYIVLDTFGDLRIFLQHIFDVLASLAEAFA